MPFERKLAAIMFTDIAGYTEQMSKDESVAISLLNKKESVLKPLITKHNGTYVKSTGDGSLSHFNSAVDAATCAKRFQESIYDDKDLNVRVGVHLGDTIFEKDDIRGDGVNIASRLESMAVEGGVFVSKEVHDQLVNQKEFEGVSLGLQSMKGVGRVIEVFGLKGDLLTEPEPSDYKVNKINKHTDKEVPSIAIIPFENKGAEEDTFFAYGISADLISDCSGAGLIRVAGLKDIEKLDYTNLKYEELSEKLLVRYIAQGTLWKMDNMFQLSVEFYDTKDKKVVWSDRWQEKWDNLPTIKSSLSNGLLKALNIKPRIGVKTETDNTQAYEYYLKGKYKYTKRENMEDIQIAQGFLKKSIQLDSDLFDSIIFLAWTYKNLGNYDKAMSIYAKTLKRAEKMNDLDAIADLKICIGSVFSHRGEYDKALQYKKETLEIEKKLGKLLHMGGTYNDIGNIYHHKHNSSKALEYYEKSIEVAAKFGDERSSIPYGNKGNILYEKGNYDLSIEMFTKSFNFNTKRCSNRGVGMDYFRIGTVYLAQGDYNKASNYCKKALVIQKKLNDKRWISLTLASIGKIYFFKSDYMKAIKMINESLEITNNLKLGGNELKSPNLYLYLSYKYLNKKYNKDSISDIINSLTKITYRVNYILYLLLEDSSYLKTAYKQVQRLVDNLESDVAAKFFSYPIPKAIVEEWEKVK